MASCVPHPSPQGCTESHQHRGGGQGPDAAERAEASSVPHCARVLPQVFTPKATKSDTKLDGKLAAKYVFGGGMESEVTLATSGVLSGTFEAANVIAKGLVVNLECETPAPGKSGLLSSGLTTVNYKTGPFDCKASYDFYKGDLTGAPPPSHSCRPPEQRGRAASLLRRLSPRRLSLSLLRRLSLSLLRRL